MAKTNGFCAASHRSREGHGRSLRCGLGGEWGKGMCTLILKSHKSEGTERPDHGGRSLADGDPPCEAESWRPGCGRTQARGAPRRGGRCPQMQVSAAAPGPRGGWIGWMSQAERGGFRRDGCLLRVSARWVGAPRSHPAGPQLLAAFPCGSDSLLMEAGRKI